MVQQVKTYTHNGGVWTRPDIPSTTAQLWKCYVCNNNVDSQLEEYQIQAGDQLIDKIRYIPASRYWHGRTVGIEFCSPECSIKYHQEENGNSSIT